MRKEYRATEELFSQFSSALVAGDTAILSQMSALSSQSDWFYRISELLRRGVVVRTPSQGQLDTELRLNADNVQALARLTATIDRKSRIECALSVDKSPLPKTKKSVQSVQQKAHRLITEEGMPIVAACRKVRCRPSDYYIYRNKLKHRI